MYLGGLFNQKIVLLKFRLLIDFHLNDLSFICLNEHLLEITILKLFVDLKRPFLKSALSTDFIRT